MCKLTRLLNIHTGCLWLVGCVIGQQVLWVHNLGMVNSLVRYIISVVVAPHCLASKGEEGASTKGFVASRGEEGASTKGFVAVGVVCGVCGWLH